MGRKNFYLYIIAFTGGLTSLAVELAASSLLRPHFGTANLVWAAIIGLILLYLTAGYFLGGRWADRSPHPVTLYQIVAWAAFLVGLVPFVAHPVLGLASPAFENFDAVMLGGSFATVLILFSVPVTLLGCISPFVIRLAVEDVTSAGQTAGHVYAISTAGSFLGAFLPDLLLVPTIGTRNTFVLLSLLLLAVALVGLASNGPRRLILYLWMPVPEGMSSSDFATVLFEKAHVVVAAGTSYGAHGEGYFRVSLTVTDERLSEAMDRIRQYF